MAFAKDLRTRLYDSRPALPAEAQRRSARVSRLIAQLHGHGLIAKMYLFIQSSSARF